VVDLTDGRTVYEYNADTQRVIASNTKLFTSAAALDRLGPGYLFETELLAGGRISRGMLEGDLAVVGAGDPGISGRNHQGDAFAVFRRWAKDLKAQGIHRITGDLVLVHGLFEGPYVHPDWPTDQLDAWYEAPVAALSFSDNCALVRIWPGVSGGAELQIDVLPRVPLYGVVSSLTSTTSSRSHGYGVKREQDHLRVWGSILLGSRPLESWIAVHDPVVYFGTAMREALALEGVVIDGLTRLTPRLPDGDWQRATVHRSDLLSALEVVNKRSQNLYAESIIKLLGARSCGRGDWPSGVRAVSEFLERIGIPPGAYSMADGSGMSRNNRFTPRQVTTLLGAMFGHRYATEFLRTLAYSGEQGLSWQKRLAEAPYRGNVFAKTGRLSGVSTLSGYAKGTSGRVYAFSVLCNETRGDWGARAGQDAVVRAIVRNG
jgi:D-alanyl-D-alanine carboxypeptidase/D-alanyl-D-alanine-endopeptidase (penicillin-binding protein 4)